MSESSEIPEGLRCDRCGCLIKETVSKLLELYGSYRIYERWFVERAGYMFCFYCINRYDDLGFNNTDIEKEISRLRDEEHEEIRQLRITSYMREKPLHYRFKSSG